MWMKKANQTKNKETTNHITVKLKTKKGEFNPNLEDKYIICNGIGNQHLVCITRFKRVEKYIQRFKKILCVKFKCIIEINNLWHTKCHKIKYKNTT